ncbi:hypothetical protein IAD21_01602 [Abditibacteriota bacterium]|nr:hypothetical protein IAD21_01602 [Abditibacteriota bacterium]
MSNKISSLGALCAVVGLTGITLTFLGCASSPVRAQDTPTVRLARVPDGGLQPEIVVSGQTTHLLYFKGNPKNGDLFYTRSTDGGTNWQKAIRVNSVANSALAMGTIRGGQLAIGREGRVFVVWNGSDVAPKSAAAPASERKYGAAPLLFARLNDAGDAFEPERNLITKNWNLDGGADVAADEDGRVYVAWHAQDKIGGDETTRRVFLATSTDDGTTFTPETPVWDKPTGACGCCAVRLRAEKGGKVALLYRSATDMVHRDTYMLQSSDGGHSFAGQKIAEWNIAMCPMSSFSFAPHKGGLMAAWENEARVYFSPLNTTGMATKVQAAPQQGANAKYPTLASNGNSQTLLLWTQNTSWGNGGDAQWELFDAQMRPLAGTDGQRANVPAWSFATAFTRSDGGFTVLY